MALLIYYFFIGMNTMFLQDSNFCTIYVAFEVDSIGRKADMRIIRSDCQFDAASKAIYELQAFKIADTMKIQRAKKDGVFITVKHVVPVKITR